MQVFIKNLARINLIFDSENILLNRKYFDTSLSNEKNSGRYRTALF